MSGVQVYEGDGEVHQPDVVGWTIKLVYGGQDGEPRYLRRFIGSTYMPGIETTPSRAMALVFKGNQACADGIKRVRELDPDVGVVEEIL
jgi:hypothetical protein